MAAVGIRSAPQNTLVAQVGQQPDAEGGFVACRWRP